MERDELIEEQDREAALLLFGLRRGRGHHRGHVRLRPDGPPADEGPARAAQRLGRHQWLVGLGVVRAEPWPRPARLRDEVFEQEDVVAKIWRVAELVRERPIAGDEVDVLVLVLDRLAKSVQIAVARDDEPDIEVGLVLVEELERSRDEDRVAATLEDPAAHALRDRDRLHAGELEGHEQGLVLGGDLLAEDRELHANGTELGRLLQDRLQDRKCGWQCAGRVLAQGVVNVLPVN